MRVPELLTQSQEEKLEDTIDETLYHNTGSNKQLMVRRQKKWTLS